MAKIEPRFIFRGDAVGAAGRLVRDKNGAPVHQVVPVLAASSLPVIGGISEAKAENCTVPMPASEHPFLCVDEAVTSARSEPEGTHVDHITTVSVDVKNARILNRVSIDSVKAELISRHPPLEKVARISPQMAEITGLKLDGHELAVTFDINVFKKCATKEAFVEHYATNEAFRAKSCWRVSAESPKKTRPPEFKGTIIATIVKSVKWVGEALPGVEICGNIIKWPGVGTIYLGEYLICQKSRRLTMFRLELGGNMEVHRQASLKKPSKSMKLKGVARAEQPPDEGGGEVVIGETQTNGTTIP